MSDFALAWSSSRLAADLEIDANDLVGEDGLETAVLLSLFTDRRAEPGDTLPDGETDRRGWWADGAPVIGGDQFGSRLWLLARSKQTPDVLDRAQEYTREALAWLLEDKIAESIDVVTAFLTERRGLGLTITIRRPRSDPAVFRFGQTWSAEESRI